MRHHILSSQTTVQGLKGAQQINLPYISTQQYRTASEAWRLIWAVLVLENWGEEDSQLPSQERLTRGKCDWRSQEFSIRLIIYALHWSVLETANIEPLFDWWGFLAGLISLLEIVCIDLPTIHGYGYRLRVIRGIVIDPSSEKPFGLLFSVGIRESRSVEGSVETWVLRRIFGSFLVSEIRSLSLFGTSGS